MNEKRREKERDQELPFVSRDRAGLKMGRLFVPAQPRTGLTWVIWKWKWGIVAVFIRKKLQGVGS